LAPQPNTILIKPLHLLPKIMLLGVPSGRADICFDLF
jgi:hypothetical protein